MKAEPGPSRRLVIDTNVWISALLTREGAPAVLVRSVLKEYRPVFSPATFAELEARLWKPKFDRYVNLERRQHFLHDANACAHWVDVPEHVAARSWCRDADDDKFIHAAIAAEAPWLITGDRDLLEVPEIPGLRILTPTDALADARFAAS